MDKEATANDLAVKMTAQFGVPMTVRWDFGTFRLVCTRVDGKPLTPGMEEAFTALLRALSGRRVEMSVR
jgi:hypothetical protein